MGMRKWFCCWSRGISGTLNIFWDWSDEGVKRAKYERNRSDDGVIGAEK